ncbi:hypothetical protein GLOIN_2v1847513 [Rhizophagus clarus]|uniref:Uncharacterized protein n=1 Tax=Rhizophagus clarus TaxID=94130 RepID=A0A8H3QY85_9GLOM|nr:hypothetical protein GLOIN_2v1847513 [Rhizophagus clarus]
MYTLKDINNKGHRLGSAYEQEFEKKLYTTLSSKAEINDLCEKLLAKNSEYSEREENIENKISQSNVSSAKVRSQLISERKSHSESQRELEAKYSAEVKSLKSQIKTLKREGTLAQKASFADKIKIISLEVKVRELKGKLEDLKPDPLFHNSVGETIEDLTQTDPKVIDSLRLELEWVKEDLNSKEYEIESVLSNPPLPPVNDSSQNLPGWLSNNLRPLIYKLGLENKVMEFDKRFARENILEALQELLSQDEMVSKSGVPIGTINQVESSSNQFVHS